MCVMPCDKMKPMDFALEGWIEVAQEGWIDTAYKKKCTMSCDRKLPQTCTRIGSIVVKTVLY